MKKVLLAAALTLAPALSLTGKAAAQEAKYGTEVCVNASLADQAKQRFPNATLHVLPDFTDREMNGWRIISGAVGPNGRIMTDDQEIKLRKHESSFLRHVPGE